MVRAASRPAEEQADRRSFVTLPLSQLVPGVTKAAFKKRSPAGATLMADWAACVGPRLAAATEPRRLSRGQLTIACSGPMAMELQHLQSALIERINVHAGQNLVERIRFIQDHVGPASPALPPQTRNVAPEPVDGLEGPLAEALASLLHAIRQRG